MKFKEFLKLIKQFDCKALEEKEVEHCFADSMSYLYAEEIKDFVYDADRKVFRIITGGVERTYFDNKNLIKGKTAQ